MKYETAAAFRRALEDRLRAQSLASSLPLVRLRKMVAFERFLARLAQAQGDLWVLKGGLALQFRIGDRARTTKDVDMLLRTNLREAQALLRSAAVTDLGDWFHFEIGSPSRDPDTLVGGGLRFRVRALLDGRPFEGFHADVGSGDPVVAPLERLTPPPLLAFAQIPPVAIPCYPIPQQIAEKVHALTRPHPAREGSRAKDLWTFC